MKKMLAIFLYGFILLILTACRIGMGPSVDINVPRIGIDSHINGEFVSGVVTLSGYVEDDAGIDSVSVVGSGDGITGSVFSPTSLSGTTWSASFDTTGVDFSDGEVEFVITATDNSDKSTEVRLFLTIDNGPPTVLVTSPENYPNQEFNKDIIFKGEAEDTTRVAEVRVSLYDDSGTPVFEDEAATGTTSWYYPYDASGLPQGDYHLKVLAEDKSGNTNDWFYHFYDVYSISLDPADVPGIEDIHLDDHENGTNTASKLSAGLDTIRKSNIIPPIPSADIYTSLNFEIDPNSDDPQFTFISPDYSIDPSANILGTPQRLSGFVEDDDAIDETSLMIAIWEFSDLPDTDPGYPPVSVADLPATPSELDWTSFTPSGNQWSYDTALPDGDYWMALEVADIYGTIAQTIPTAFKVSSFAPVVTATSPAQGTYVGNDSTITLQVHVTGLGSGDVELDPNGDNDFSDAIAMTENPPASGDYDVTVTEGVDFIVAPGEQFFRYRAGTTGNFGNAYLQYTRDDTLPTVSVEVPPAGTSVNGTFNVLGTSSDDNLVSDVYLWIEEDAAPDLPGDPTNWNIPDSSDVYNWRYSLDTTALNSGAHTIHVAAFDAAGNQSAAYSSTFDVDQESDRPIITFTNVTEGGVALDNSLGQDAEFIGYIEDDDNVDVSTLQILIDIYDDGLFPGVDLNTDTILDPNESESWEALSEPPGSDGRVVNWKHSIANLPQGQHSMWIRVFDVDDVTAGTDTNPLTNPNYAETTETEFIVDYGPPDLSITGPANNTLFNADFTISGDASDANGLQDVEISFNGGAYSSILTDPVGSLTTSWTYDFTVDGSNDGNWAYQVRATDMSGGVTTLDRQVRVDATAPTVVIGEPAASSTVNGNSVQIRGTADDNDDLVAVYIDMNPLGNSPEADHTLWDYTASGTFSWSQTFDSFSPDTVTTNVGTAAAEDWVVSVRAVDDADNVSIEYTRTISIDQESDRPVIDFSDIDKDETIASNNVLVGATNLTGIIEDDDTVDHTTIEISIDGGTWTAVSDPPASSGKIVVWKHDISALIEGVHTVKVRAQDTESDGTVGLSSTSPEYAADFNWNIEDSTDQNGVPFILNFGPPSITITSPANYSYHNTDVTIAGTASDANDVNLVEVSFDNGATWTDLGVTPGSPVAWSHTMNVPPTADGTYSYLVRATDTYGATGLENGQFTVDATLPTAIINQPLNGATVNGLLTFSGTASDNISLNRVYWDIRPSVDPAPAPGDYIEFTGNYAWNDSVDTTGLTDLTAYTLRILTTDAAGNYGTVVTATFTVDQSTDRPDINLSSIDEAGDFTDNLLPGSKQIAGTIIDDDGVEASSIQYRLYDELMATELTSGWTAVSGQPGINSTLATWTHTFGPAVVDGRYQMLLRAADINDGGVFDGTWDWDEIGPVEFSVDSSNPTTTITSPASNGGYTNTDFTVAGEASDAGGVKSVTITYPTGTIIAVADSGGPYNTTEAWTDTFDVDEAGNSDDGVFSYTVSITDAYDKIHTVDRYINVDTVAPVVAITAPSDGSTVNGNVDIRGTSNDSVFVSGVYMAQGTSLPAAPAGNDPDGDPLYTQLAGTTSWNHSLNSTAINDTDTDSDYYITIVSVDVAGNVSGRQDLSLVINQGSDRPVIDITSIDEAGTFNSNLLPGSKQVTGTVTDDDGVSATTIQYRLWNEAADTELTSGWTDVGNQPSSDSTLVSWIHTFDGSVTDGRYNVEIRAADTNDAGAFDGSWDWNASTLVPFSVDTGAPAITMVDMDVDDAYGAGVITKAAGAGTLVNNSFLLRGTATDGNSVTTVEISTDGSSYTAVDSFAAPDWSHTITVDRTGHTDDGTMTVYVNATDEFGKSTITTLPLIIDTYEPGVTPTQPSDIGDTDPNNVNGPVTIRGTVTETTSITSFTAIGGDDGSVVMTNSGTDLNWAFDVDTDLYYGVSGSTNPVTTETGVGTNIWRFPIDMEVFDAAGNRTIEAYNLDIDPDADKPVLYLTAPTDASSVAGAFIVQGTVTDDDDIQKVTIQVDLDNDGAYTSVYDLDGDLTFGNSPFEDESAEVDISVTNGSWNILMNDSSEFSKDNIINAGFAGADGWIGIRVIPYDNDPGRSGDPNLAGDPVDITIYVDSTLPIIEGQSGPLPEPAAGSIVSGTVNLLARVKDDSTLDTSRIQISYDGGATFASIESEGGTITPNGLVGDYYEYDVSLDIDTTDGNIVTDGNGVLQTMIRVTDETFKQNSMAVQLNADNTLPDGTWNYAGDLADVGGIYSFFGSVDTVDDNMLIGSVEDTGTISGIARVEAYFVKNVGGNDYFYNPTDGSSVLVGTDTADIVSTDNLPAGPANTIPYPQDNTLPYPLNSSDLNPSEITAAEISDYIIYVDKRTERGLYDSDSGDGGDGDGDGFEESLRSRGTFDEWYVFYDTTVFPDGPMDLYTVIYDTAGNYSYELVDIQIVNNPPSIDSIEIDGIGTLYTGLFKRAGSVNFTVNASDAENIDGSTIQATITQRRTAPNGADAGAGTFGVDDIGTVIDFADVADATSVAATHTLDVSGWEDGIQFTLRFEARDSDGNVVYSDVELWVNNTDATPPTLQMDDLGDSNYSVATGHIEPSTVSTNDGGTADADISGTVTFTGIAYDDTIVTDVEISFDSGTTWYSVDNLNLEGGDDIAGFDYTWDYTINTGDPTEVADWTDAILDHEIQVRAHDGSNIGTLNSSAGSPNKTVDIVPYITEIERGTTGLRTNRSRFGRYTVYQSESTINVRGFNLNPASAVLADDPSSPTATNALTVSNIAADSTSFDVATGAATLGGWLRIDVDGLDAINNTNDNDHVGNNVHGTDADEDDYSDDRYFFVFDTGDFFGTAFNGTDGVDVDGSYNPRYPVMTMNPASSRLFGAWSYYGNSDVFFASTDSDTNTFQSRVYHTFDTAESVDISMESTGTGRVNLAWLSNNSSDGNYTYGHVSSYPYDRTTNFINGDTENDAAFRPNQYIWQRTGFSNYYYIGEGLGYDSELEQFTQIRTERNGNNVHWAYHDTISKTVKYQYQDATNNSGAELQNWVNVDGTDTDNDGGENNREVTNGVARTNDAGEFLDLTLDEDGYPVLVYYDNENKTLRLAYTDRVNPGANENLWTRQEVLLPGDSNNSITGKHISAVVDDSGIIHISFWSEDSGYLYYVRSTNNPEGGAAYTFGMSDIVDATGTAGAYSDLTLDRTTDTPYIAYMNSARVNTRDGIKYAFFDAGLGDWEYIVVANETVVAQKRISVEYDYNDNVGWDAAFGYASDVRFMATYLMPEVE